MIVHFADWLPAQAVLRAWASTCPARQVAARLAHRRRQRRRHLPRRACRCPCPCRCQMPMMPAGPLGIDEMRDGSGTSWLPEESPMSGAMRTKGSWTFMLHGNAFLEYIRTTGTRGDHQLGSVNWLMGMAERDLAGGRFMVRAMTSLEPLTVGQCGYPNLLQSGELCRGAVLHDDQHPHDLFMEVALDYRHAIFESRRDRIVRRPGGRARTWPGGVHASAIGDGERHRADQPPLARLESRQLRGHHRRALRPAVEGGIVGVQRTRTG